MRADVDAQVRAFKPGTLFFLLWTMPGYVAPDGRVERYVLCEKFKISSVKAYIYSGLQPYRDGEYRTMRSFTLVDRVVLVPEELCAPTHMAIATFDDEAALRFVDRMWSKVSGHLTTN